MQAADEVLVRTRNVMGPNVRTRLPFHRRPRAMLGRKRTRWRILPLRMRQSIIEKPKLHYRSPWTGFDRTSTEQKQEQSRPDHRLTCSTESNSSREWSIAGGDSLLGPSKPAPSIISPPERTRPRDTPDHGHREQCDRLPRGQARAERQSRRARFRRIRRKRCRQERRPQ